MKLGINFTTADRFHEINHLVTNQKVDFVELMVDNFLHLDPTEFLNVFERPVSFSFHIMSSRIFDREIDELKLLAKSIKDFIDVLQPTYVSDHLAHFMYQGRLLPKPIEIDYSNTRFYLERAALWQDLLGTHLLYENFASCNSVGRGQAQFIDELGGFLDSSILFDVSNAIVAENNGGCAMEEYTKYLSGSLSHLHIAGYSSCVRDESILVDTHSCRLTTRAKNGLKSFLNPQIESIVLERDLKFHMNEVSDDLEILRNYTNAESMFELV